MVYRYLALQLESLQSDRDPAPCLYVMPCDMDLKTRDQIIIIPYKVEDFFDYEMHMISYFLK